MDSDIQRYAPSPSTTDHSIKRDCLRRAIALSLQHTRSAGNGERQDDAIEIIDSDDDDDDDDDDDAPDDSDKRFERDLERALTLSQQEAASLSTTPAQASATTGPPPSQPVLVKNEANAPEASVSSFISERAKLEQARLERLKRLRPDLVQPQQQKQQPPSRSSSRKRSRDGSTTESSSDEETTATKRLRQSRAGKEKSVGEQEMLFWNMAEIRQTANALADPAKDTRPTWRLSEIIGPVRLPRHFFLPILC
jgi:tyrosyl-DNA phosphodiesterase 1